MISMKVRYSNLTTLGAKVCWWLIENGVILEDLVADTEVLNELKWGFAFDVWNTIDGVAKLAVILADGVNELEGASDVDLAIVVEALGVWPGSAGGQVPAEGAELTKMAVKFHLLPLA